VDEREVLISKALSWVLKRTIEEGEEQEGEEKLVADAEGWVDCEEVILRPNLQALQVTFPELQALVASPASKPRFSLKIDPSAKPDTTDASDFLIRANQTHNAPTSVPSTPKATPITAIAEDLPDLIVYETSYANYPLILASGGIKRAGGQAQLQFASIKVQEDGTEVRPSSDADVSIYIDLRAVMEANDNIKWSTLGENVITEGDATGSIDKKYWKKAVATRKDIGILFENGEVRKEVPIGLRGKGVKSKKGGKGKGRGLKEMKARSEDEGTGSD